MESIELAALFHSLYEKYAPEYGYITKKETRDFKAHTPNGKLMIRVCQEILTNLAEKDNEIAALEKTATEQDDCILHFQMRVAALKAEVERLRTELTAYKANNYDPAESIRLNGEVMALKAEMEKYREAT